MAVIDLDIVRKQIDHQITEHPTIRSRRDLARAAGINQDTFGNFFKSSRKNTLYADDLYNIATALGCSMETLVTRQKGDITGGQVLADRIKARPELEDICERLSRLSDEDLRKAAYGIDVAIATVAGNASQTKRNGTEG